MPILLVRGWKPGDVNSKHGNVIAWNIFDLVKNYQYPYLQISLLCLSILVRFRMQKIRNFYWHLFALLPLKQTLEQGLRYHWVVWEVTPRSGVRKWKKWQDTGKNQ